VAAADLIVLVAVFVSAREEAKRKTIQPIPITLRHVQSRVIALHTPEDRLGRHVVLMPTIPQFYSDFAPPALRWDWCCASPARPTRKGGNQQSAGWWATIGVNFHAPGDRWGRGISPNAHDSQFYPDFAPLVLRRNWRCASPARPTGKSRVANEERGDGLHGDASPFELTCRGQ
jgi:hypothetical protein